ncbi:MAG: hypothetical protein ACI8S6_005953, partial [Myxococcota bacterium]
ALPCFPLAGPPGAAAALLADGTLLDEGSIEDDGTLSLCPPPGSISPDTTLSITVQGAEIASGAPDVRPFGHALGRLRAYGAPTAIAWGQRWIIDEEPFFAPDPESWYRAAITSPQLVGQRLFFAGKEHDDDGYRLGMVELGPDGLEVVAPAEAPLLEPDAGGWDSLGQVSPTVVDVGDGEVLFYQGLGEGAAVPVLGQATSTDGRVWEADGSIYGDASGDKVSHPSALYDEASGVSELWHLSSDGSVALSLAGDGFTAACQGLPMRGKSPEVTWAEDRYIMTWATVSHGEAVIRWAESFDGLRWIERSDPVLWASDAEWTRDGLSNAQLVWLDGQPRLLLVGVSDGEHRFGLARPEE